MQKSDLRNSARPALLLNLPKSYFFKKSGAVRKSNFSKKGERSAILICEFMLTCSNFLRYYNCDCTGVHFFYESPFTTPGHNMTVGEYEVCWRAGNSTQTAVLVSNANLLAGANKFIQAGDLELYGPDLSQSHLCRADAVARCSVGLSGFGEFNGSLELLAYSVPVPNATGENATNGTGEVGTNETDKNETNATAQNGTGAGGAPPEEVASNVSNVTSAEENGTNSSNTSRNVSLLLFDDDDDNDTNIIKPPFVAPALKLTICQWWAQNRNASAPLAELVSVYKHVSVAAINGTATNGSTSCSNATNDSVNGSGNNSDCTPAVLAVELEEVLDYTYLKYPPVQDEEYLLQNVLSTQRLAPKFFDAGIFTVGVRDLALCWNDVYVGRLDVDGPRGFRVTQNIRVDGTDSWAQREGTDYSLRSLRREYYMRDSVEGVAEYQTYTGTETRYTGGLEFVGEPLDGPTKLGFVCNIPLLVDVLGFGVGNALLRVENPESFYNASYKLGPYDTEFALKITYGGVYTVTWENIKLGEFVVEGPAYHGIDIIDPYNITSAERGSLLHAGLAEHESLHLNSYNTLVPGIQDDQEVIRDGNGAINILHVSKKFFVEKVLPCPVSCIPYTAYADVMRTAFARFFTPLQTSAFGNIRQN